MGWYPLRKWISFRNPLLQGLPGRDKKHGGHQWAAVRLSHVKLVSAATKGAEIEAESGPSRGRRIS